MARLHAATLLIALTAWAPAVATAQTALTLEDAMSRARAMTPAARAVASAENEAAARVRQARAGYFPRVDLVEAVQRGDQPVFVFSSLLSQRRFTAANFDVARLNNPAPLTNVRTGLAVEQPLFDAGATRYAVRGAELGRDLAAAGRAGVGQDLAMAAAESFVRVMQLEASNRATQSAVDAAASDLDRARARRDVGLVTEADVLAVEVHLADMRQRQIQTAGELEVARLQLREAVGMPLDAPITVVAPARQVPVGSDESLVADALRLRPERRESGLRLQMTENARAAARAALLPTVGIQAGWDFNGSAWNDQRSSWLVGVQARVNVFQGFRDAARLTELRHAETRATAEREQIERRIAVDVRAAQTRVEAARAREAVGRATLAQARESQRIIRDRYENGLATVTDVLRAAEAALDAESRATTAETDVILQTVALDRAVGRL